jgi:hypothetical protein
VGRGEETSDSDLDLLVDADRGHGYFDMAGFALGVEDELGLMTQVATPGGLKLRIPRPRAPGGRRPVRHDDERLLLSRLLPLQNQLQTTKSLFQENLSTDKPDRTLGVCQPRQEAALRPAATNGLSAQSRPVEHRHADDAVARGAAIAKCRYRRRDSDPLG